MPDLTKVQLKWLKDLGNRMDFLEGRVAAQARYIDNLRGQQAQLGRQVNGRVVLPHIDKDNAKARAEAIRSTAT